MTVQTLTPTLLVPDGAGLDIAALLAAPTQTQLQFANTGVQFLAVQSSTAGLTVAVSVGATVLGQAVPAFTAVTLTSGHLNLFGPFHSVLNQPGTPNVLVTLSSITNITVALLQMAGVY